MAIDLGRNRCENNRKRKVKKKNVNQMQKFSHPHKNKIKPFFFYHFYGCRWIEFDSFIHQKNWFLTFAQVKHW